MVGVTSLDDMVRKLWNWSMESGGRERSMSEQRQELWLVRHGETEGAWPDAIRAARTLP